MRLAEAGMCVCACMYVKTCVYACVCMCMFECMRICLCACAYVPVCVHSCMHMCLVQIYMHVFVCIMCIHVHAYICVCVHWCVPCVYTWMHTCSRVCVHLCVLCVHVRAYICIFVCVCVCEHCASATCALELRRSWSTWKDRVRPTDPNLALLLRAALGQELTSSESQFPSLPKIQ